MSHLEILKQARELLSEPTRWAKGFFAYNSRGELTMPKSQEAVCWCAAGAVVKFSGDFDWKDVVAPIYGSIPGGGPLSIYNDDPGRTHQDILDLFDRTIARMEVA